jgi:hypothetical protein
VDTAEAELLETQRLPWHFAAEPLALVDIDALAVAPIARNVEYERRDCGMPAKDEPAVRVEDGADHGGDSVRHSCRIGGQERLAAGAGRETGGQEDSALGQIRFHTSGGLRRRVEKVRQRYDREGPASDDPLGKFAIVRVMVFDIVHSGSTPAPNLVTGTWDEWKVAGFGNGDGSADWDLYVDFRNGGGWVYVHTYTTSSYDRGVALGETERESPGSAWTDYPDVNCVQDFGALERYEWQRVSDTEYEVITDGSAC